MGNKNTARDSLIEDFMYYATRWAKEEVSVGSTYEAGANWGHAFGIRASMVRMGLIDQKTAAELKAVLLEK